MAKETLVSLDPIDRKRNKGLIGQLLITRWSGGRKVIKAEPFGHYMFCGSQGSGKTASIMWYIEKLAKKYKKRCITYTLHDECDDLHNECKVIKFDEPPKIRLFSNVGVGKNIKKHDIFNTIDGFDEYANEIRIVFIDEIQTYFPRGSADAETKKIRDDLTAIFSQLRKRNTFILSSAQVYGRLDKSLREQCLFMVDCSVTLTHKLKNKFIPGDDIICDDLGRWSGDPSIIYIHGLAERNYDTKKVVRE